MKNTIIDTHTDAAKQQHAVYTKASSLFKQNKFHQADVVIKSLFNDNEEPMSYEAFILIIKIKEHRGLYLQQVDYLTQALAIYPDSLELMMIMAFAQFKLCHFDKANEFAERIATKKITSSKVFYSLGKVYDQLGLYIKSANIYKKGVKLNPNDANLLYQLGLALMLSGKVEESISYYEQAIIINPDFDLVYSSLSKARKASHTHNNIAKLRLLVARDKNPWTCINLCHGLAKELDDIGNYEEAFAVLEKGKKRLRIACPHNPFSGIEHIKQLTTLYEKKVQKIKNTNSKSEFSPVFVTGMPRTGTTIVERILTNSSELTTVGERTQMSLFLKQQCQKNYAGLIDAKILEENWENIDFSKLGNDYLNSVKYLSGEHLRFVDKLPLNILLAGVILSALPKAKIICLVRDPLDTVIGNYRQVFEQASGTYSYTLDLHALADYVHEFRILVSSLEKQFPGQFISINYEDIVEDPIYSGKKLFNFCNLQWHDKHIDIHKNKAVIGTASAAQVTVPIHKNALKQSENYMFCLEHLKSIFNK